MTHLSEASVVNHFIVALDIVLLTLYTLTLEEEGYLPLYKQIITPFLITSIKIGNFRLQFTLKTELSSLLPL